MAKAPLWILMPVNTAYCFVRRLLTAIGLVAAVTWVIGLVPGADHVANISLLYLLVVIAVAHFYGSALAALVSVLSVLAFDWFFVQPRHTFTAGDPAGWLALVVFLATAVIIGGLTAAMRSRAEEAKLRERETSALATASLSVASHIGDVQALDEVLHSLAEVVSIDLAAIFNCSRTSQPTLVATHYTPGSRGEGDAALPDRSVLAAVADRSAPRTVPPGWADAIPDARIDSHNALYVPLNIDRRVIGVMYLFRAGGEPMQVGELRIVSSLANLAAVCLERGRLLRLEAENRGMAEADRLKTALLSMVSHDFRSPLASIKASVTGLLQKGAPLDPASQHELLTAIDEETDRINRMVGNVLGLSRLEAGDWQPLRDLTSVAEIVGAALDGFGAEDNARIQVELAPKLPDISVDSVQIVQVLYNLIENALKYSPADTTVGIEASREGDALVIGVADCGPGLGSGEESLVFHRFYRSPRWRESSVPGSGLGLAICSGLVEAHGGTLSAENRPDGGALFRLRLPGAFLTT